ncbi:MAG: type VI secretion system-associated FHA domain protein, partial [Pseudomonadota bacterium]
DLDEILDDRMASANLSMIAKSPVAEPLPSKESIDTLITETTQPHSASVHRLPSARRSTDVTGERRDVSTYRAMLNGLGIDPATVEARQPDDIAFAVGAALRASVQGLKAMKAARARSKQSLDMAPTQQDVDDLTPTDIKDDVVDLLLGRGQLHRESGENVASDVRALMQHQLALQEAAQAATVELLDQLEPETLQEKLAELGGGRGLFTASRKASLWDQYCRYYPILSERNLDELPSYLRDEIARAYIARLQTLAEGGS